MAQENFLINPPKRMRKRRHNPIGETLTIIGANPMRKNPENPWYGHSEGHRVAALMRWGKVRRGKITRRKVRRVGARKVRRVVHRKRGRWAPAHVRRQRMLAKHAMWYTKYGEILSHPRRKSYHYKAKGMKYYMKRLQHRRRKSNTWFGQPRRHRRAAKKGWRVGHLLKLSGHKRRRRVRHRNPMVSAMHNPRRRMYNVRHRRRHYGRRHNPAMGAMFGKFTGGVMDVRGWAPLAVTGGLSAITGAVIPGMLGVTNPWAKYGVQTAVAIGGGIVVEQVVDKRHGQAWMIVGVAMVGYQLLKEFVLVPYFPQFAVGLGAYESYYPESSAVDVSQRIDAFPSAMSAFPSGISAYPGVGEAGSYPYDGAGY